MARPARIVFVDAVGGGLAALGAALAQHHGVRQSVAVTTSAEPHVVPEVARALAELGMPMPDVARAAAAQISGDLVVVLGHGADEVQAASRWAVALHDGPVVDPNVAPVVVGTGLDGLPIERLAAARIARDRIERMIEALLVG